MIEHLYNRKIIPRRVVILGASGFIGSYLVKDLRDASIPTLLISSQEIDLTNYAAVEQLSEVILPSDCVIFLSVIGPNRGYDSAILIKNITMADVVVKALQRSGCDHLIYVSSEAVYGSAPIVVNQSTQPQPDTLYGVMHLSRELVLKANLINMPLLIFRPTQIYGPNCTHNAYGPGRFMRSAFVDNIIELFGDGEELRDFIYIQDVINIIRSAILYKSTGLANIASGTSITFKQLSEDVLQALSEISINVISKPRLIAITHRKFEIDELLSAYGNIRFTTLTAGLKYIKEAELIVT